MKLISHGIGLTAEGIAAAKASKNQKRLQNTDEASASTDESSVSRGLVGESSEYPNDKKNAKAQQAALENREGDNDNETDDPPPAYASSEDEDEADWALDDAGDTDDASSPTREVEIPLESIPSGEDGKKRYVDKIVYSFVTQHPLHWNPQRKGQLSCPVILPQRRPQNKSRGFVRAYAPALADCGIDQVAFLQFIKSMHQASKVRQ